MPLSWKTNRPPSKVRSHLPVDELANLALPILGSLSFAPLANAALFPEQATLPPHDTMMNAYKALKGRTRLLLLEEWRRMAPPPSYYTFPLSLTPHLFMGLGKFMADRIHQMRAHKRYLAAHPSWSRLEFVTGRTGPRKTRAPGPVPRPAPLKGLARGVFFGIPCLCPRSGPHPTHTPDASPLKMGGNKRGPVQGMSAGGPRAGAGWRLPYKYPPGPV